MGLKEKMLESKVVLISLPVPFADEPAMNPPLGLCYIMSYLKEKGIKNVEIVDYALSNDYDFFDSKEYLKLLPSDADYYGVYCTTSQFHWLHEVSDYLTKKTQGVIVAGGPHPTTMAQQTMLDTEVTFVVKGDGEEPMYRLIRGDDYEDIPGLCYWSSRGVTENAHNVHSKLDSLPFPERYKLEEYKRRIEGEKAAHIVTLRGCPYNCAFCDRLSVGRKMRYRSIDNVLQEMDYIIDNYGIKAFVIYDDIFTLKKDRTLEFCEAFRQRDIKWRCWARADLVDRDILQSMKDSGMVSITFGIESGDDHVLKSMRKGTTVEKNRNALLLCKELGIPVRCSLMYGNPGESRESIENTIKMIEETQPDEWNLAVLQPIPGSDIWYHPEQFGIKFDKQRVIDQQFQMTNRFADSGIGDIWIALEGTSDEEFSCNLKYFVEELERVCPRTKIQDTIQTIDVCKVKEKDEHSIQD